MFLQVREQIEKSMPKGMPQVDFLDPFSDTGPPRVDCFCLFGRFGAMPKKHVFSIDQKSTKNLDKLAQASPKGPIFQIGGPTPVGFSWPGASGRPRARHSMLGTRRVDQRERWQVRTDSWPEGMLVGSNTPVGQRPGEFPR